MSPPLLAVLRDSDVKRLANLVRILSLARVTDARTLAVTHEDAQRVASDFELLPPEVRALACASRQTLNRALLKFRLDGLLHGAQGWTLPAPPLAAMTYSLSDSLKGAGCLLVSGRDVEHYACAIDCTKFLRWLRRPVNEMFIRQHAGHFTHPVVDSGPEVVVITPVFRVFSAKEYAESRSRNVDSEGASHDRRSR